jgi:DNA invertase Pin-like site-specific DNA recombinase
VPASASDFFTEDTPTAVLVRQVLGAISQFEKATLVAKLKAARDRKKATGIKIEGRPSLIETVPEVAALARQLRRKPRNGPRPSLRDISAQLAERGYHNINGAPYAAKSVAAMLAPVRRPRPVH